MKSAISVETLWRRSVEANLRGRTRRAKVLKGTIFALYHASLAYEVELGRSVHLWHKGLGTVIHPNTTVGNHVAIGQNVTIAADSPAPGGTSRVVLEDGVVIGAGAIILARAGGVLTVGAGAVIGANAVITRDVAPGAVMVGPSATRLPSKDTGDDTGSSADAVDRDLR